VPVLGVILGLVLGLAAGGRLDNLVDVRLRWWPALLVAAAARFGLDAALGVGGVPEVVRMWLVLVTYVYLTAMLLANRSLPGITAAALGTVANGIAIVANGGWMPVWQPSLAAAGFDSTAVHSNFHVLLTTPVGTGFFAHAGLLADVIPIPIPIIQSVASVGDLLLGAGLAFFIFAAVVRAPVLASVSIPQARTGALRHPYVRLATNGPFSAIWLAQVISSLGDRVHQIALVFLVAGATNKSPLALGLVFAAMTIPISLVGPLAGALVDRWNRKWVMVGSDLLRAGLVFAIPIVSGMSIGLVVGLVFLIAVASSFFRPARAAALPHVVPPEDLLTANSAMLIADTVSDVAGYGLGGLFVAFLGSALSLAFWIDGVSYLASAALVAAVVIPRIVPAGGAQAGSGAGGAVASLRADVVDGWRFLRAETVLFATTVQASIAEYGLGALTALSPLLVAALPLGRLDASAAYGFFEMSTGVGLVGGGVVIGALANRLPKGPAIVAGFTTVGVSLILFSVTGSLLVALALAAVVGIANVTFSIPSQTIFQQRTPDEMLGRVVAIRLALVNATLVVSMVTSGLFAQLFGVDVVLAGCGILTVAAGLAGLAVHAIRDA
jgi:DHA3 family macrolide efflux protein-like MFS transporter